MAKGSKIKVIAQGAPNITNRTTSPARSLNLSAMMTTTTKTSPRNNQAPIVVSEEMARPLNQSCA
jgi:hypothetical protein